MNRVYFVRHGEGVDNVSRQFSYKKVDRPLTERGRLQAHQTGGHLAGKHIDEIYCSPMKRSHETALIIAERLGKELTVLEGFREVNVGELDGMNFSAEAWGVYHRIVGEWFDGNPLIRFPGGENYVTLRHRMRGGFEQMVKGKTDRNLLLVGHAGIFIATLRDLCPGLDITWLQNVEYYNCAITELEVDMAGGKLTGRLVDWADYNHLSEDALSRVPGIPPLESVKKT